jgi:flagellar motility protein MotE (MotC chaperone)
MTGHERRKPAQKPGRSARTYAMLLFCLPALLCFPALRASGQDDIVKFVETKRIELKEKEEALKSEEERLAALRKDVEEKIAAYTQLLARVQSALAKLETVKGEKMENVVKAYEAMAAEDAAVRLSALDESTALKILTRMKSKKAGAAIAAMTPHKAASLTRSMTALAMGQRVQ